MTPTLTAFARSPDRGRGLARDMRVRWALEEVGQPYEVRLLSFSQMKESRASRLHPFGQIPTYEEGDLALFESGAIVLHIAEHHRGCCQHDVECPGARDQVDVCRAQHGGAADRSNAALARILESDKPWYRGAPAHARGSRPCAARTNFPLVLARPTGSRVHSAPVTC